MIGINRFMKRFYPTYLYIKTHNITGLKYFGKTTNDPYQYYGSGKHWLSHLRKHGFDISTEVLGYYTDEHECKKIAEEFSKRNNIVKSKKWANMIVENGLDGGATGRTNYSSHTNETKTKIANANKGKVAWNKGKIGVTPGNKSARTLQTKQKLKEANLGKKQSTETIEKRRSKLLGRIVTDETRKKISKAHKGKIVSEQTKQKLRSVTRTNEQKTHLRNINLGKKVSSITKEKLSGKVVVVDQYGQITKITKEQYRSQSGPKEYWKYVAHRSKEAQMRRG
jgi:hypothetical protein